MSRLNVIHGRSVEIHRENGRLCRYRPWLVIVDRRKPLIHLACAGISPIFYRPDMADRAQLVEMTQQLPAKELDT